MAVKARDAIREARLLIGTPYATLDCINLIKRIIRKAPGGVSGYTTSGSNALWESHGMSAKHRDLTWRQEGIAGARAGMLAFKCKGSDVHHVGLVTGEGTVIHASSAHGETVETPLTEAQGWTLLAVHRYITPEAAKEDDANMLYRGRVKLNDETSTLNVRNAPEGDVISELHHGAPVEVLAGGTDEWLFVRYGDSGVGYVAARYIAADEPESEDEGGLTVQIVITDEAGNVFRPVGAFAVDVEMLLDGESID